MPIDYAGNSFNASRKINISSGLQSISDWVGRSDIDDFYTFSLSGRSSFNLDLNGLSDNANVQLFNSKKQGIGGSYKVGNSAESITTTLNADTYYIRVFSAGLVNTNYKLSLSAREMVQFSQPINQAPQSLDFSAEKSTYKVGETVNLVKTKVFDGNGISDLDKIDFWLQKDGNWQDIGDAVNFTPDSSDNRYGSFNYSLSNLQQGNYYLQARAWDKSSAVSNVRLIRFSVFTNSAPQSLDFSADKSSYQIGETINLVKTKVFDADGISDLAKVDFRLQKDAGSWQDISDAVNFNPDGSFSYSLTGLAKGNYRLQGSAYDKSSAVSNTRAIDFTVLAPNSAPQSLEFSADKSSYQIGETINLVKTKVSDADGISDLAKVDFRLQKDNGDWQDISDVVSFSPDGSFSYSLTGLAKGNYRLQGSAYDKSSAVSNTRAIDFTVLAPNSAPQSLEFSTDKSTYQVGEIVNLVKTKVIDANGVSDLTKVDFTLQKDSIGTWQDISDAVTFNPDGSFSYSLTGLAKGNYQLKGQAYDKSNTASLPWTAAFIIQDWFDFNLKDQSVATAARTAFADNQIDRKEAIAILRSAEDGGVVDGTELLDLRNLVANAVNLGMPDYVRVLTNKIVNGDIANQNYQGSALGYLDTGSSDSQMEKLINKWFYGGDRPATSYNYQYVGSPLFKDGISYQDIKQGAINDCFLMTGLAATALRVPTTIQNMFIDNGDDTFTIRFYKQGVADYVTVDKYLPTNNGYFVYANATNELWVSLLEKAYAQINESWKIYSDSSKPYPLNSYNAIGGGGYISDTLAHITGSQTSYSFDFNSMGNMFNSGQLIGLASKSITSGNIVASHAYTLVGYNSSSQRLSLYNPWGSNIEISWDELQANFSSWDYTTA
jgi:Calpain family cysteine protease/Bacterial pre-peptidase C-terminal domain